MTVTTFSSAVDYTGDGVSTTFAIPFKIASGPELAITVNLSPSTIGVGHTASVSGGGGTVTFLAPPRAGAAISIRRATTKSQTRVYVESQRFPAQSHEKALDRLTMVDQELGRDVGYVTGRAGALEGRATTLESRATAVEGRTTTLENRFVVVTGGSASVAGLANIYDGYRLNVSKTGQFWADDPTPGNYVRLDGRIFSGTPYTGNRYAPLGGSWLTERAANYFEKNAQNVFLSTKRYGTIFGGLASDAPDVSGSCMPIGAVALNEGGGATNARAIYAETFHKAANGQSCAIETQTGNWTGVDPTPSPYDMSNARATGIFVACEGGGGYTGGDANTPLPPANANSGTALDISGSSSNTAIRWKAGVVFRNGALARDENDYADAVRMARHHQLVWYVNGHNKGATITSDVTNVAQESHLLLTNRGAVFGGVNRRAIAKFQDDIVGSGAVNWLLFTNSRTNVYPSIVADGADANVGLSLQSKGVGPMRFLSHGGAGESLRIVQPASAPTDYMKITGSAGGGYVTIGSSGASANIDINLAPKGAGVVKLGAHTASEDAEVTGYITVRDSANTLRKLAVIA